MSLESFGYFGNGIAGIASIFGLSLIYWQIRGIKNSISNANAMAEFEFEVELNKRKEKIADIRQQVEMKIAGRKEITDMAEKETIESLENYRKECYENYLNIFDSFCRSILKKRLNENELRIEYREMLFSTIEKDTDDMLGINTKYRNMRELYDEWKKK